MALHRIPCLVGKRNKAGRVNWYWQPSATLARAGWKPVPLGQDEGAAIVAARARNAEVERWRSGAPVPATPQRHTAAGTMSALIARYRREVIEADNPLTGRPRIRASTAETYKTALDRIDRWAGKHPVEYVTPARVRALRDAIARPPAQGGLGHHPALQMLKLLRQVFAFAESVDLIPRGSNPARNFGLGAPTPRASVWEQDDEAAFRAAALDLGLPGMVLAMELALYTAQRQADLLRFTEAQLVPLTLYDPAAARHFAAPDGQVWGWRFSQGKTETPMQIPFEPAMLARVQRQIVANRARDRAATPPRLLTHVLIDDRTGRPWVRRAFAKAYRQILDHAASHTGRAHMESLTWHDLRRTRVVRLRRGGTHPAMIAQLTGHEPKSIEMMLSVYGPIDATMTGQAILSAIKPAATTVPTRRRKSP